MIRLADGRIVSDGRPRSARTGAEATVVTAMAHRLALLACAGAGAACGWRGGGAGAGTAAAASGKPATAAPLVVKRGALEDRFALTGELEAVTSENLVVPRTPSWLLSIRWLADEGSVVKKGDRVVEFDSSSFAGTLEDKRLAVIRTGSELAGEMAKATADRRRQGAWRWTASGPSWTRPRPRPACRADLYPRRVYQEKQLALARSATPWPRPRRTWRPTGGPPAWSAR